MEKTHTPPAYRVATYSSGAVRILNGETYAPVCLVLRHDTPREKTANKIVTALNSHEALVEAVKGLLWLIDGKHETDWNRIAAKSRALLSQLEAGATE